MNQGPETVEAPAVTEAPVVTESRAKKFIDFSKKAAHALWLPSMIANLAGVAYLTLAEAGKEVAKNNPLLLQVMTAAGVVQLLGGAHALERRRSARKAASAVAEAEAAKMGSEPEKAPEPEKAAEPQKAPEPEKAAEPADPEKDTDPDKTATDSEAESNDPDSEEDVAALVTGSPVLNAAQLAKRQARENASLANDATPSVTGSVTRRRKAGAPKPS
jgi:hypothetical protein